MHVSFRNRLTFFFILLVIVPVLAVGFVGFLIVRDSEGENTETTLTQAQKAAQEFYRESRERSDKVVQTVSSDEELAVALRGGDRTGPQDPLDDLAPSG